MTRLVPVRLSTAHRPSCIKALIRASRASGVAAFALPDDGSFDIAASPLGPPWSTATEGVGVPPSCSAKVRCERSCSAPAMDASDAPRSFASRTRRIPSTCSWR
jgi:hypothetical protein